jgi:hypothetical protein
MLIRYKQVDRLQEPVYTISILKLLDLGGQHITKPKPYLLLSI